MNPIPRNIMLTLAYDGTAYHGWQVQPNGVTIQECVESALENLTRQRTRVLCAGRTDSGVHALGQVASFFTESTIPAPQYRRALPRFLPEDIVVLRSQEVHPDFHATFSAERKRYRYLIWDAPVVPPVLRNRVGRTRRPVRLQPMQEALPALLGTHDFRCFETHYPNKATSVRTIFEATVERQRPPDLWTAAGRSPQEMWQGEHPERHEAPEWPIIALEFEADGFLYNMVRAIVGTLLRIGNGQRPPEYLAEVIAGRNRGLAGSTAAACGLCLLRVDYPEELLRVPERPGPDSQSPNGP